MIEVRNTLFQPLMFQLKGGAGLHLGPRERRRIHNDQLSPEIEKAAGRGMVALVHLPDEPASVQSTEIAQNTVESSETETSATDPGEVQIPNTTRKRR